MKEQASKMIKQVLRKAQAMPELKKRGPRVKWQVDLQLVSRPIMTKLNWKYRKKRYATDVLSFSSPPVFRAQGWVGELVICLPVLRLQARELGHEPEQELRILIVHGLLHLLGFDHEKNASQAKLMSQFEARLLGPKKAGLIERVKRGKD